MGKLDIGYIDMMLLHHPGDNDVKAYLAMEKYVKETKGDLAVKVEQSRRIQFVNVAEPNMLPHFENGMFVVIMKSPATYSEEHGQSFYMLNELKTYLQEHSEER